MDYSEWRRKRTYFVSTEHGQFLHDDESVEACRQWCEEHNIDGSNGDYIAECYVDTYDGEATLVDAYDIKEVR